MLHLFLARYLSFECQGPSNVIEKGSLTLGIKSPRKPWVSLKILEVFLSIFFQYQVLSCQNSCLDLSLWLDQLSYVLTVWSCFPCCQRAKMAEEESKKKRGKRKGLGGLTPEKKKKLKVGVLYHDISKQRKHDGNIWSWKQDIHFTYIKTPTENNLKRFENISITEYISQETCSLLLFFRVNIWLNTYQRCVYKCFVFFTQTILSSFLCWTWLWI